MFLKKNVVVTMDTVDFIESDVGKDYLSYKPGHQTLKDIQNKNYGAYKKRLLTRFKLILDARLLKQKQITCLKI